MTCPFCGSDDISESAKNRHGFVKLECIPCEATAVVSGTAKPLWASGQAVRSAKAHEFDAAPYADRFDGDRGDF